mmetsp:Transcript_47227/g.75623  ORF Transcript_47227/g.75623 Transcript_47227/m.75623 type:complete len:251 (+) Transcript_47227:105-857(+)
MLLISTLSPLLPTERRCDPPSRHSLRLFHHPYTLSSPRPVIMPSTGGRCAYEWKHAVMTTVARNSSITSTAPGNSRTVSPSTRGGTASLMYGFIRHAGTSQFTADGMSSLGNSSSCSFPFCHTMRVVRSPKGEKAPPALAATTMFTQHIATYSCSPWPRLETTAPISTAVVRLSAMGESQKAIRPVIQKHERYENPPSTSHMRMRANTLSCCMVLMNVMAHSKNRNTSTNSVRLCRAACVTSATECPLSR